MPSLPENRGMVLLGVALTAGLSALAAWSFRTVFDAGAGFPLVQAILAPTCVAAGWGCLAVLLGRRALGPDGTALAVLSVAVAVALTTRPGADVWLGPSRLLTGTLPTDPSGPELATISIVGGFTALIAVRLVVSARNPWLPLIPPACCLMLGLGLGAAIGALPGWYAPTFAAASLAVVLSGRRAANPAAVGKGRLAVSAAITLAAAAAAYLLGPLTAADRSPASLQELVDAPVTPKEETNPMARYLALRDNLIPLEITGTASQRADRVRMVTLNHFDGQNWTIRADYRRAGTQLPVPAESSLSTREISLDVRVLTPDSVGWLPRVGRPNHINVADLGFDRTSGDIVVPNDRETPSAYRITGVEPVIDPNDLRADDPVFTRAAALTLPPKVLEFVTTATAGRATGLSEFLGLYQAITNGGFSYDTSAEARGGHGLRQITDLLENKRGTSEQYASAFAVLSRHLGWDARIVLGFRPTWEGDRFHIRGKDVFAWVEVRFQHLGWVPVDPSPTQTIDNQGRLGSQQAKPPDAVNQVTPPDQPIPQEPDGNTPPVEAPSAAPDGTPTIAVIATIVAIALILYVGLTPLARTLRRRRARLRGTPRQRTIAAWRDTVDALRDAGVAVNNLSTTGEVVKVAQGPVSSFIHPLADMVDWAAYSPETILHDRADLAWQCSATIRAELRKNATFPRRLRNTLNPRSLWPGRAPDGYRVPEVASNTIP